MPTPNDPETLARILLGPDASPEEIQQMLHAIASQGGSPEPAPQSAPPSMGSSDWTRDLPGKLHPLGRSGKSIAGAGAIAASPFLAGIPGVGPELAGAAFGGGLSALADEPLEEIAADAAIGSAGGTAGRVLGPMMGSIAGKHAPQMRRMMGSNDQAIDDYLKEMGPKYFFPRPYTAEPTPQIAEPGVPPNIDELLRNMPVQNLPQQSMVPRQIPGYAGRASATAKIRPPTSGVSSTLIRRR